MGIIDWSIVVLLVIFFAHGLRRGFATIITQLLGYVAVFLLVGQYFPLVRNSLVTKFSFNSALATVSALLLIAGLTLVVVSIMVYVLNRTLKITKLSFLNRLIGGLFSLLNALLVMMILMVLLDYIPSLSTPLKNKDTHLAYATIDELKTKTFNALNLKQHMQMLESKVERKIDIGIKTNAKK